MFWSFFQFKIDVLKTSYQTQKGEWTFNEMTFIINHMEEDMKKAKVIVLILLHMDQLLTLGISHTQRITKGPNFGKEKS